MATPVDKTLKSDACEMRVWVPVDGVALLAVKGNCLDSVFCDALPFLQAAFPRGVTGDLFCDGWEIAGYETKFRVHLTGFVKHMQPAVTTQVLMRTKLVAMGFAVANIVLGGKMVGYQDRDKFYRAIDEKIRLKGG